VADKPAPGWYSAFVVDAARRGDPYPLIGRLRFLLHRGGVPLSDGEIEFIVEALEATSGKLGADNLRKIERELIAGQVEDLKAAGLKKGVADQVARQRGRSRRHIFKALRAHKKKG
jgi:hypothetical protein